MSENRPADVQEGVRPLPGHLPVGLADVATVSFLASRAAPTGGFVIALAGGTAMARAGQRHGARRGYGASLAAMIESVAIMGPARFGVPLTQALTAPMMGRMEARGISPVLQWLACALIRMTHNATATAFFIWVILGGLDAYAGSYDALFARLPGLPSGETAALVLTAVSLAVWTVGATAVQVVVYRRGMARWPEDGAEPVAAGGGPAAGGGSPAARPSSHRFDPRAVTLAAAIAFALLVSSTDWALLGGVTAWLVVAAVVTSTADRGVVATGAGLAAILAGGALVAGLVSGLGADLALRRALRAALLVLVATWLRAAAGSDGVREVARRVLGRLGRIPAMAEAAEVLDRLGSDRRLAVAGRSLQAALSAVPKRPLPVLDALLGWVAVHSSDFVPDRQGPRLRLEARLLDALLVALAAVPVLALASALPAS